jgi:glycerol-3-phosphate dehydrogenase
MPEEIADILIVGGGVNGAGIARDAAGRGLRVVLCEAGDLGGATSSASSKLIHGGLRYLEHYEFRLVREALAERERLLRIAPHIIWPMRFVLPHDATLRPAWMIRAGLFLYDNLARRQTLPGSRSLDFRRDPEGRPLRDGIMRGFAYSDCWVEDSRLVVLNARDAADMGAEILTRTRCVSARRDGDGWLAVLEDRDAGTRREVRARILVNAAGPWAGEFLTTAVGRNVRAALRLVKGSHIVVPRLYDGPQAYILQNEDRRICFVIPYERDFTLIGTTDVPYEGDPAAVAASDEEVAYLCAAASRYLKTGVSPSDVVRTYAGVRPLYDDDASADPSAVTRDYVLELEDAAGAPLLNIFGGKLTTYRRLAEAAMAKLAPRLPGLRPSWTGDRPLPGGDMPGADWAAFRKGFGARHPWLPERTADRLCRLYGTQADRIVGSARGLADMGEDFGAGLHEAELDHLVGREWARTADDALWRRTKAGLHLDAAGRDRVAAWFARRAGGATGVPGLRALG